MNKMKVLKRLGAAALGAALTVTSVFAEGADGGALIDALIKKGVLTSQEGEEIRAEMLNDYATTPGGFLSVGSSAVKGLKLYGDARVRYEYDQQARTNGTAQERNRNRYRLRVGAEYTFADGYSANVRLATGNKRNSTNADGGAGNSIYGLDDTIYVDVASLSAEKLFGADWLSASVGRILQPHNIAMGWTWDSDITADGGVLKLGSWKVADGVTLGTTHGAYIWTDGTDNPFTGKGKSDVWLFINQLDLGAKLGKNWKLRFSPGFVSAIGSGKNNLITTTPAVNDVSDMNVFLLDVALDTPFFIEGVKGKLYGEYGVNLSADDFGKRVLANHDSGGNQFFLLGYQIAKGKGKGAWTLDATYAYYEALSWSAALIDSDWNGGKLNGHGIGLKLGYGLTDNVTASVNWRKSWRISSDISSSDLGGGTQKASDLVQVDLSWKF
ncbi:MAG: putative porin [Verrucomicrobiales bacterium]|jgi:hypothetical protein|nr:putative porin [Verrucomicrobiales bacterium]